MLVIHSSPSNSPKVWSLVQRRNPKRMIAQITLAALGNEESFKVYQFQSIPLAIVACLSRSRYLLRIAKAVLRHRLPGGCPTAFPVTDIVDLLRCHKENP